jgi:predicted dehydrogenase
MKTYQIAVVGCGKGGEGVGGHSIGHAHAISWTSGTRCQLKAACDLNEENLKTFCDRFQVAIGRTDLSAMLAEAKPDIVSICTYAGSHRAIVDACIDAGVRGIWCEKPFALCMDDARHMAARCAEHGVKMIVNHARRPLPVFARIRELLEQGAIGEPMLFAASLEGWDQMEWGTHWHDMFRFWAGDQPVDWVFGQARCTSGRTGYGHPIEDHSVGYYAFQDGTRGLLDGGKAFRGNNALSVMGTAGVIHLGQDAKITLINASGLTEEAGWGSMHPGPYDSKESVSIPQSLIAWMEGGGEPDLSVTNALKSTEIYLAIYESAKNGDKVDLPLGAQAEFPLTAS